MTRPGGRVLALAIVVVGAAACTVAAPMPSTVPTRPFASAAEPSRGGGTPTPAPSRASPVGALSLDVGVVDPAWTEPMLDFASDGESVLFSSGVADGPDGETAPDLWRYTPGAAAPELLWRNPRRDRTLVRIGGDRDVWVFDEMPVDNTRAWNLWLLTEPGGEARLLDTHPGDEAVPSLVPSFVVSEGQVAWTAFDRGRAGEPVSQLLYAAAPDWEPRLIAERSAGAAELWFPSLRGSLLAYTEVVYSGDRTTDERHVYLTDLADPTAQPRRLDTSGLATMPLLVNDGVVWKEAERGFSMFNWGRLYFHDLHTGDVSSVSMHPQEDVNYPSAGLRFVAAWSADAYTFTVHDLELTTSRLVERHDPGTNASVPRAHVSGDLLVWVHTTVDDAPIPGRSELRYAFLPGAGTDRDR